MYSFIACLIPLRSSSITASAAASSTLSRISRSAGSNGEST
nr:MAG TPA: hypothetical protein [Caudoviricetes sp.]